MSDSPPDVAVELQASGAGSTKIALPPRTFAAEGARQITIEAWMADGRPLPSWVRFDPRDGSFTLDPPADFESSSRGEIGQSKPSLSEQLRAAGEDGLLAEAAELLELLAEAAA